MKAITMNDLVEAADDMPDGIGAIMVFAPNTYYFNLGLHNARDGIGKLFEVHRLSGIRFAQVSEDIFGAFPVAKYHENPVPVDRTIEAMHDAASGAGVNVTSFGTGAELYLDWMQGGGIFDSPDNSLPKRRCFNYIDIAASYPVSLICGHRVPTVWPKLKPDAPEDVFYEGCALGEFANQCEVDIGDLDPKAELTDAEVMNLKLGLELQRYGKGKGVSSTMELMYQPGMEPITIEQMKRAAVILGSVGLPVFIHMDTGHVVVGEAGKEQEDFSLLRYGEELGHFPYHTIHYCALDRNRHLMPTKNNIAKDLEIKRSRPKDVPYPEDYCDVREYLDVLQSRGAKLIEISPEPKEADNLVLLGNDTRDVYEGLAKRHEPTHSEVEGFKGLLVPNGYLELFKSNYVHG